MDMIFLKALGDLGLMVIDLKPTSSPFHGVIPGKTVVLLRQITLPVTFGSQENYRTKQITFEVANFEFTYHAIIGRPAMAKFMVVPHYPYLTLKMRGLKGVLVFHSDPKHSFYCDVQSCELVEKQIILAE